MRLSDLIEDMQNADESGMEILLVEEQYRGSPALYAISGWDFRDVEDEDAEPEPVTCGECKGEGVVEDDSYNEDDPESSSEMTCPECGGDGEVEGEDAPTKQVLVVWLNHEGYAPSGCRQD